jgi:hypothetical protein
MVNPIVILDRVDIVINVYCDQLEIWSVGEIAMMGEQLHLLEITSSVYVVDGDTVARFDQMME